MPFPIRMLARWIFACAASSAMVLVAVGCQPTDPSPAPATSASESAAAVEPAGAPATNAQAKALEPPGGTTPVDGEIIALQAKASQAAGLVEPWVLLGRAWIKKARGTNKRELYAHAEACAKVVFETEPGNLLAKNLVGEMLLEQRRYEEARNIAQEILGEYPVDIPALGTLSDALRELGRYDEAVDAADKMNSLKPGLPAYARAGYLQWLRGDDDAALVSFRAAAQAGRNLTDPEPRVWTLVQAAEVFWHKGDHKGAKAGFVLALKEMPGHAGALAGKGKVALALGEHDEAVELLSQSYDKHPLIETAWRLGDAKSAAGDSAGAEEAWAKVLAGKETDRRVAALFLATKNRDAQAAVDLAKADLEVRPGIYGWDAYAWALYRAGRHAEAKEASDKAMKLGTKDPTLLYHAGAIRIALGDVDQGRQLVARALDLNPKFDPTGAAEAAKLIAGE